MKNVNNRVVAIDYFRGICILVVLLSHSYLFSMPFAYLSGLGKLWTSAAEMFFLLSGITFGIVRGPKVLSDFKAVLKKSAKRAFFLYGLSILMVLYALVVGLFLASHGRQAYIAEGFPSGDGKSLLINLLTLHTALGWADFLMYYSIILLAAPFALYLLKTRLWAVLPLVSAAVFVLHPSGSHYGFFAIWQVYFFIGLTLTRFRPQIIAGFYGLPEVMKKSLRRVIYTAAVSALSLGILLGFNLFPLVNRLTAAGWLPGKAEGAYRHLLTHQSSLDNLFLHGRAGTLRPIVALVVLAAAYLFYQQHKDWLLRKTGALINQFGRETLWVYTGQAVLLPWMAALPFRYGNLPVDLAMTSLFFYSMWLVARRKLVAAQARAYISTLRFSYNQAKYGYLQKFSE
jgi:hypothetical protein